MSVRFSNLAERDLEAIFDYIAQENPIGARDVIQRILRCVSKIEPNIWFGSSGRVEGTNEIRPPGMDFIAVCTRRNAEDVDVERVLHRTQREPWTIQAAEDSSKAEARG